MNKKQWSIIFITLFCSIVVGIGCIVVIIDPFFHFHRPLKGVSYSYINAEYVNDGISKNFQYEGIITGTSMTKSFRTKKAEELFDKKFIRVTYLGEGFKRIGDNLKIAIENNPDIDIVIRGIDTEFFITDKNWLGYEEYPEYLYDNNILNDVKYIYNKEILINDVWKTIIQTIKGIPTDEFDNHIYDNNGLTKEEMLKVYSRPEKTNSIVDEEESKQMFFMLDENIEQNVIKIIKENPQIEFYLFFPPYSICWWDKLNQNGIDVLKRRIHMEQYVIEKLLMYENVKLFSFFNNFDLICDCENYFDDIHYVAEVNDQILRWMKEGKYQLTQENYRTYIEEIMEFYCNYDYDVFFEN